MDKKKKHLKKNFLDKFNEKQTKGNIQNTLLKGAVDTVAGSVVGTGIGAITGNKATFVGLGLILAGHYIGDKSGVLRLTGASTMAYGIGKANEYKNNPELSSPTKRLSSLKDDWLAAFHLKWKKQTNQSMEGTPENQNPSNSEDKQPTKTSELTQLTESTFPDLSVFDQFESLNQGHASSFDDTQNDQAYDDEHEEEYDDQMDYEEDLEEDDHDEIDEFLNGDFDLSLA
jgi:F0F1-type ATP synthase assembly protein I